MIPLFTFVVVVVVVFKFIIEMIFGVFHRVRDGLCGDLCNFILKIDKEFLKSILSNFLGITFLSLWN